MSSLFRRSHGGVCLALSISSTIFAATPVALPTKTLAGLKQQFDIPYLESSHREIKGIVNSLQFIQRRKDNNGLSHIRLQQYYSGFLVFGGYAILHSEQPRKNLNLMQDKLTGVVYEDLEGELNKPSAEFTQNAIKALTQFQRQFKDKGQDARVEPLIYIDQQHKAHWAYKVSVSIESETNIPTKPTAILDANSYHPFIQWDGIKTVERHPVKGMGYGGNPKIGKCSFGKNYPPLELMQDAQGKLCFMENRHVKIVDMKHNQYAFNDAIRFPCKPVTNNPSIVWTGYTGNGYDKINGAYSPSNDALYVGQLIHDLYQDWYNLSVLTTHIGDPMQLIMRIHYGKKYSNAYWNGKYMTFGDGGQAFYPLVSLGIAAHEISHGFTEQHADLIYHGQSGGINEAFSDMAAQAAEFYASGENDWRIGREILKEKNGDAALRYMD